MFKIINLDEFIDYISEIASYASCPGTVASEAIKFVERAEDAK